MKIPYDPFEEIIVEIGHEMGASVDHVNECLARVPIQSIDGRDYIILEHPHHLTILFATTLIDLSK